MFEPGSGENQPVRSGRREMQVMGGTAIYNYPERIEAQEPYKGSIGGNQLKGLVRKFAQELDETIPKAQEAELEMFDYGEPTLENNLKMRALIPPRKWRGEKIGPLTAARLSEIAKGEVLDKPFKVVIGPVPSLKLGRLGTEAAGEIDLLELQATKNFSAIGKRVGGVFEGSKTVMMIDMPGDKWVYEPLGTNLTAYQEKYVGQMERLVGDVNESRWNNQQAGQIEVARIGDSDYLTQLSGMEEKLIRSWERLQPFFADFIQKHKAESWQAYFSKLVGTFGYGAFMNPQKSAYEFFQVDILEAEPQRKFKRLVDQDLLKGGLAQLHPLGFREMLRHLDFPSLEQIFKNKAETGEIDFYGWRENPALIAVAFRILAREVLWNQMWLEGRDLFPAESVRVFNTDVGLFSTHRMLERAGIGIKSAGIKYGITPAFERALISRGLGKEDLELGSWHPDDGEDLPEMRIWAKRGGVEVRALMEIEG